MDHWDYNPAKDAALPPMQRLRSEVREPGLVSHIVSTISWHVMRAGFVLYNRLEVVGTQHIPQKPPFVLVGNHASHLDALVLGACVPRHLRQIVYPIAAGDVFFESPTRRIFAATTINALPIWRKKVGGKALDDLKSRLHSGECAFILFPEGARTRDGKALRWKPGIGMMVAGTPIPIVPCRIDGCFEALTPGSKVMKPRKIRVTMHPAMTFENTPNSREGWEHVAASLKRVVVGEEPEPASASTQSKTPEEPPPA